MANTEDTTPQPQNVAKDATQSVDINLNDLTLLGVFGRDDAPEALLRLPNGQVEKVSRGSKIGGQTVIAIDETRVALSRGGRARWLEMPAG